MQGRVPPGPKRPVSLRPKPVMMSLTLVLVQPQTLQAGPQSQPHETTGNHFVYNYPQPGFQVKMSLAAVAIASSVM